MILLHNDSLERKKETIGPEKVFFARQKDKPCVSLILSLLLRKKLSSMSYSTTDEGGPPDISSSTYSTVRVIKCV